jgi:hypothetical protein
MVLLYLSDSGFAEEHQLDAAAGLGSTRIRHICNVVEVSDAREPWSVLDMASSGWLEEEEDG